ncbi:MAG TPA: sensor histidine kinase, partial [Puia sp.]
DYNQLLRNWGEAMIDLREALALYQETGHKALQGVYDLMGIISTDLSDYPGAVRYGLLAAQTAEALNDTTLQLCTIYSRLGVAYGNWGKNSNAMVYLKKALDIAMKYRDADAIGTVVLNMTYRLMRDPKWEETQHLYEAAEACIPVKGTEDSLYWSCFHVFPYMAGGKYAQAAPYINDLIRKLPWYNQKGLSLHFAIQTICYYFLDTHQYKLADKYTSDLVAYARARMNKRSVSWAYMLKSRADSGLGDYRAALQHYQLSRNMADSMTNEAKNIQFAQMQVMYETEKKQQHIELLTSQNQLQEVGLKKAGITRNIIIVTALLLSALLFTGYQFKKRSNAKLRAHQAEIHQQNERLKELLSAQKRLLEEKEWLVKEIHHRVKNNLQVVISLLNTQSEYLDSPSAIRAIRESRERMQAIAIIHQKLYQADNTTVINMPSYIEEMITFLSTSLTDTWKVRFELEVEEINLDISQAVPLGLMLNEAVTNAIKYAFPGNQTGTLFIQLTKLSGNRVSLKIRDNGPGLPADFNPNANNSLGMQLMRLFSEQLEGDLLFTCNPGVQISLVFKQYGEEEKKTIATIA